MPTLYEQRDVLLKEARAMVDEAKAANRDFTDRESKTIEGLVDRAKSLMERAKKADAAAELVAELAAAPTDDPFRRTTATKAGGSPSRWARGVMERLDAAASGAGVKALLSGEVSTAPAVEVVDLPAQPLTLLDLVARDRLDANNFSYLRQTVRESNAAVVADGATKPTSIFTFTEIEDRARVVAHLSEPFPLRFLNDHSSMVTVIDGEMRQGVTAEVERLIVEGTGTGEEFAGILATTGVTAVPFETGVLATLRRARTVLAQKGELPTAWVVNPTDLEALDLMREDGETGGFLMNSTALDTVFGPGIARVASLSVPVGTAILADWSKIRLQVREDVNSLAATQAGDLFQTNRVMLRAEGRYGLKLSRPQAIAVVDLTA